MNTWHIRGARIVDPVADTDKIGDIYIRDGIISRPPTAALERVESIDARGLVVAPGFIDMHVHFREPGDEKSETIESGAAAAARGGFTTVVMMPNTSPPLDTPERIGQALARGREVGRIRIMAAACITKDRAGRQLSDFRSLTAAGAIAFTDDGSTVTDDDLMLRAMQETQGLNVTIMDHALDPDMARYGIMHEGASSVRLGVEGIPSQAETKIVRRDVAFSEKTGCPVHIQHVSAKESIEAIRSAKTRGALISAEVTPHHLALTDADVRIDQGAGYKMNPPLRTEQDRRALIEAVMDGTIDALATDHAPHQVSAEQKDLRKCPFGVVGLETALGVTYTVLVRNEGMPVKGWIKKWTVGPARILGLTPPSLSIGQPADLVILDLETEWTVNADAFLSKSRNTPFEGKVFVGRSVYAMRDGKMVWREPTPS